MVPVNQQYRENRQEPTVLKRPKTVETVKTPPDQFIKHLTEVLSQTDYQKSTNLTLYPNPSFGCRHFPECSVFTMCNSHTE